MMETIIVVIRRVVRGWSFQCGYNRVAYGLSSRHVYIFGSRIHWLMIFKDFQSSLAPLTFASASQVYTPASIPYSPTPHLTSMSYKAAATITLSALSPTTKPTDFSLYGWGN